jgi:hypothetical protein
MAQVVRILICRDCGEILQLRSRKYLDEISYLRERAGWKWVKEGVYLCPDCIRGAKSAEDCPTG